MLPAEPFPAAATHWNWSRLGVAYVTLAITGVHPLQTDAYHADRRDTGGVCRHQTALGLRAEPAAK